MKTAIIRCVSCFTIMNVLTDLPEGQGGWRLKVSSRARPSRGTEGPLQACLELLSRLFDPAHDLHISGVGWQLIQPCEVALFEYFEIHFQLN